MERIFIIGAGQVGRGLSRAFLASGSTLLGIHGRRSSQYTTSSGDLPAAIRDANVVIVAVRDPQIDGVLENLAENRPMLGSGCAILHTSGVVDARAFGALRGLGFPCGTFHPLAPFAEPDRAPELLRGGWIGIDGDDAARSAGRRLAAHVGARTIDIPEGGKTLYHAAAVMASNFPVALAAASADLMRSLGIPERSANSAVESLMRAAVGNLATKTPAEALTGPVVRGDPETVRTHLTALMQAPATCAIYRNLSRVALDLARERGTDAAALDEIQRILTGDEKKRRI